MSRPPAGPEPRSARFEVRVTPAELEAIEAAARAARAGSTAAWVRAVLLEAAEEIAARRSRGR